MAVAPQQKTTALQLISQYKDQIAEALPDHVNINKMVRVISSQISQNPELALANPISLMSAVMRCAQLGLEPGSALSKIHLIPFNNRKKNIKEVNVIIGYQGLLDLARRSGEISEIYSEAVYKNDYFAVAYGEENRLEHKPDPFSDRGEFIGAYAFARFKDGGKHFITMGKPELEKIRNRSKYPNPIWNSDYAEMAKKTCIRRLSKYLPLSAEKADAFHTANNLETKIEIEETQGNNEILIEAGVPVPEIPTVQQQTGIDSIVKDAKDLIQKISDEIIHKTFNATKTDVIGKMLNEKSATDILIALKTLGGNDVK